MEQQKSFDDMSQELIEFLKKVGYSSHTILRYQRYISHLRAYLSRFNFTEYSSYECEQYISSMVGNGEYADLEPYQKNLIHCANIILEYHLTGAVSHRTTSHKEILRGNIGKDIYAYIDDRKACGLSDKTIKTKLIYLVRFKKFLDSQGVEDIKKLQNNHLHDFVKSLSYYQGATVYNTLLTVRGFLRFLYASGRRESDLSYLLPKSSYKKEAKLPTTYTQEEIKKCLSVLTEAIRRENVIMP